MRPATLKGVCSVSAKDDIKRQDERRSRESDTARMWAISEAQTATMFSLGNSN